VCVCVCVCVSDRILCGEYSSLCRSLCFLWVVSTMSEELVRDLSKINHMVKYLFLGFLPLDDYPCFNHSYGMITIWRKYEGGLHAAESERGDVFWCNGVPGTLLSQNRVPCSPDNRTSPACEDR